MYTLFQINDASELWQEIVES